MESIRDQFANINPEDYPKEINFDEYPDIKQKIKENEEYFKLILPDPELREFAFKMVAASLKKDQNKQSLSN